jgi:hypothetical protein
VAALHQHGRRDAAPIGESVAKAMADIGGSPAGLVCCAVRSTGSVPGEGWNWPEDPETAGEPCADLIALLEESRSVLDFGAVETGRATSPDGRSAPIPTGWQACAAPGPVFR